MNFIFDGTVAHDASSCFILNNNLHFLKLERFYQQKHFGKREPRHLIKGEHIKYDNISALSYENFFNIFTHNILKKLDSEWKIFSDYHASHHLMHAHSVDFLEQTPCDVHIVIDGKDGHRNWYSVFRNRELIDQGDIEHTGGSIGDGMFTCGDVCGITGDPLDVPGKVMGLQSYGVLDPEHYEYLQRYNMKYIGEPMNTIVANCLYYDVINKPGNNHIKNYARTANHIFKIPQNLNLKAKINYLHTIHKRVGEIILSIFEKYAKPYEKIGYSGGVAQNVIWNTMLKKKYPRLTIYPHCGDEGLCIGRVFQFKEKYNIPNLSLKNFPYCQFDEAPLTEPSMETISKTAKYLADGKIVAWYQGHGEIGPRALGNRSILMDPRIHNGKDIINTVKNREYYRPFGSSVLAEYAKEYFDLDFQNPYMLYLGHTQKSNLPAITHVDGTSRAQTVDNNCGYFRLLLEEFYEITGCPVLLNTSLNEAGKPIAGWIKNAENLFQSTAIDILVVGDKIYTK